MTLDKIFQVNTFGESTMENSSNQVQVTVTPNFCYLFRASLTLIRYQGALAIIHVIFPLTGLFILIAPPLTGQGFQAQYILAGILALFFTPLITVLCVWLNQRKNKLERGSFVFTFHSEGISTSGTALEQTIKWQGILRVRQSKRFLFIFLSPRKAICISLAALKEQGVYDAVCAIIKQHTDFK